MSNTSIRRSNLKSLSCLFQPPQEQTDSPLIPSLHSQKINLSPEDQEQLFQKTLAFLTYFFKKTAYHQKITEALRPPRKPVQSPSHNQKALSFKKMGSRVCFSEVSSKEIGKKELPLGRRESRCANKKISIFIMEEADSQSSQQLCSDQIFSQNSIRTIRSIEIPKLQMNLHTIQLIYESPQPFLINLSLCLFVRYCIATNHPVTFEDSAWVLTISTILAYKLYYDQEIEGLMECFMDVVGASRRDLIDLERCFLEAIDYNTVISNYHYHFVLAELLAAQIPAPAKNTFTNE